MYHITFIHSSVEGHLGWFELLIITKKDDMSKCPYGIVGYLLSIFPGMVQLNPEVELCQVFWEKNVKFITKVVLQVCTSISCGVAFSLHHIPGQHMLSLEFFILAILRVVRWNLRVILICISLMTKDLDNFYKCFSGMRESYVENSLFSSVHHFLIELFGLWISKFLCALYVFGYKPTVR